MQLVPILAACGVVGITWLLFKLVESSIEPQVSAFARLLGGYRPDGWPIGVQEEDRDRPWGVGPADLPEDDVRPTLSPVQPAIRLRGRVSGPGRER